MRWIKFDDNSWLYKSLPSRVLKFPITEQFREFERIAAGINRRGPQPLWEGYRSAYQKNSRIRGADLGMQRLPDQVRTQPQMGRFFAWLAEHRKPELMVEIGTAFGVSALYWASGLKKAGRGRLITFEPNAIWQEIAKTHLRPYEPFVTSVKGTFEQNIDVQLDGEKITMAFIDAIHTAEFVDSQIGLLLSRMRPNGIIVMDDITFSDDMRSCWERWARDKRARASVSIGDRVGLIEFD